MSNMDSNEYFEQKKSLLSNCVKLSEQLLSNISDLDIVNDVLTKRSDIIQAIQDLDSSCGKEMTESLPEKQKKQLDQIVSLLLGLDQDAIKIIKKEQADVKNAMKVNTQNHKMVGYKGNQAQPRGRVLDIKK